MGLRALFRTPDDLPFELTSDERSLGKRRYRHFLLLNGISVALIMENMLILYAIRNGASDPVVALIGSFLQLTMPAMIIGKRWVTRIGLARTWGLGWLLRYASGLLLLPAPLFVAWGMPGIAIGCIIAGAFGFAFFRSIGAVANTPLTGEVTTPDERGSFIAGNHARLQSTYIVTMATVILIFRVTDDIRVYQAIIAIAALVGFYASTVIARVPESVEPQRSASVPIAAAAKRLFESNRLRKLLFAWSAGFVAFTAVIPFAMITVKNGYGVSDYEALTFSLILVVGAIASAMVNGLIADRVGPRPLIVFYTGGLFLVGVFWAVAPSTFLPVVVGLVFFFAGFAKTGIITGLGHYFLSVARSTERVGASLLMRVGSGAAAGLTGSVLGALLLQILQNAALEGLGVYHWYFRIMLVPLAFMVLVVSRLDRLVEWKLSSILGLLVSPRDLRALFVLNRLRRSKSSSSDKRNLERLEHIASPVSEDEIREQLASSRLGVRLRAIRALRSIAIRDVTTDALIREVETGEYTTAGAAAEILGDSGKVEAIPALRAALDSHDHLLQGRAMTALVRLGDEASFDRVREMFSNSLNPRVVIHGANALALHGNGDILRELLARAADTSLPASVRDEVMTAAASMVGAEARVYRFLRQYNVDKSTGVTELLPDLTELFPSGHRPKTSSLTKGRETSYEHFREALRSIALRVNGEYGRAVHDFLATDSERPIPRRALFCAGAILAALDHGDAATGQVEL